MRSGNERAVTGGQTRDGLGTSKLLPATLEQKRYSKVATSSSPLRADLLRLIERTAAEHGPEAFAMPKRAAAVHEAGHAVLYEADGVRVRTVRIKRRVAEGQEYWGGRTSAGNAWRVYPGTPLPIITQRIRFELAGVLAEVITLGDDFRQGSSLDEVAKARQLSAMAAIGQFGVRAADIYVAEGEHVVGTLVRHQRVLLDLADALETEEWIRGHRLAELLAPLREAAK